MNAGQAAAKLASLESVYIGAVMQEARASLMGSQVLNQLCDLRDKGTITQQELDAVVTAAHLAACEILHGQIGI